MEGTKEGTNMTDQQEELLAEARERLGDEFFDQRTTLVRVRRYVERSTR
jgi:hypothetical protein